MNIEFRSPDRQYPPAPRGRFRRFVPFPLKCVFFLGGGSKLVKMSCTITATVKKKKTARTNVEFSKTGDNSENRLVNHPSAVLLIQFTSLCWIFRFIIWMCNPRRTQNDIVKNPAWSLWFPRKSRPAVTYVRPPAGSGQKFVGRQITRARTPITA